MTVRRLPHPKTRRIQDRLVQDPVSVEAMADLQVRALVANDRKFAFKLSRRALATTQTSHIPYLMVARVFSAVHFHIASYFSAPDLACRRALLLAPDSDEAWIQQIKGYRGYQPETLVRWVRRLGCIAPSDTNAALIRIRTLFDIGEDDRARAIAREALRTQDDIFRIALNLSLSFEPEDVPHLELITKAVDRNPGTTPDQKAKNALIAARLAHRSGDVAKAFEHLKRSVENTKAVHEKPYDVEPFRDILVRQSADAWTMPTTPPAGNRIGMVMVSGLPRSGTTLMESRLARHADIRALGETFLVEASYVILRSGLIRRRDATREMASVLMGQDSRSSSERSGIRWFSEKMPMIVAYDGVMRSLLDEIRTVIIVRPFLSTWISGILMGLAAKHPYFLDPKALIRIYELHLALAETLFGKVEPSKAVVVTLEGLSEDPDGVSQGVRERLDLPAREDADEESGPSIVRTVSQGRVRTAVSRTVSDQYLPYRALLDPETLAVIDRADTLRARFLDRFEDRLVGGRD